MFDCCVLKSHKRCAGGSHWSCHPHNNQGRLPMKTMRRCCLQPVTPGSTAKMIEVVLPVERSCLCLAFKDDKLSTTERAPLEQGHQDMVLVSIVGQFCPFSVSV